MSAGTCAERDDGVNLLLNPRRTPLMRKKIICNVVE
jgi:hypothetical protein